MATIDAFRTDPFSMITLTDAVERNPFRPTGIGALGVFEDRPIRTTALAVEQRAGTLLLIPTSPRGAPATERTTETRTARYFGVPRLRHGDTIRADEIQGVREFGSETEVMQLQSEVARRLGGPTGLQANMEYTYEHMRLAAIQGILLDSDGSTTLYNWFTEFGISAASEVAFALTAKTVGSLRPLCNGIVRAMARAAQGAFTTGTRCVGICGDTFWDEFVTHPDVENTFKNWEQAVALRQGVGFGLTGGAAEGMFDAFTFGNIDWMNYRGSDDTTSVAIATDKVKFFPRGAPGVFAQAWAPAENFTYANTLGRPQYVQPIFDIQRNEWWRMELSSYPLYICTRPEVLFSGKAGA